MLGSQLASIEDRSPLQGLFASHGLSFNGDMVMDGGFTQEMERQLGGLLVELGMDPTQVEGMDAKALLANLQALFNGSLIIAEGQTIALDTTAFDVTDTGLGLAEDVSEPPRTEMSLAALRLFLQANKNIGAQNGLTQEELSDVKDRLLALAMSWLDPQQQDIAVDRDPGQLQELRTLLEGWLSEQGDADWVEGVSVDDEQLQALAALLHQWSQANLAPGQTQGTASAEDVELKLVTLLRQWVQQQPQTGSEPGQLRAAAPVKDAELAALLRQWVQQQPQTSPEPGQLRAAAPVKDAELAVLLRQWLQQQPQETGARQAVSVAGTQKSDVEVDLLLRQLVNPVISPGIRRDETPDDADLLARLRTLLGANPENAAPAGSSRAPGSPTDFAIPKPLSALFAQAMSDQAITQETISRAGHEVSAADALSLLKASLTTSRGESVKTSSAETSRSFDLARLLTPDGARQMAAQLAQIARARDGMAEIKLRPPSLGAMEVRVVMEADKAHVHFASPNSAVRDLLEAALPRLREALAQDGLALGDASVSDQPPQRRDQAAGEGARLAGDSLDEEDEQALLTADDPALASTLSALTRKLDLFA
jgi:flagellar hook-length control protein FliK